MLDIFQKHTTYLSIRVIEENICGEDTTPFGPDEFNTLFTKPPTNAKTVIDSYSSDYVCCHFSDIASTDVLKAVSVQT